MVATVALEESALQATRCCVLEAAKRHVAVILWRPVARARDTRAVHVLALLPGIERGARMSDNAVAYERAWTYDVAEKSTPSSSGASLWPTFSRRRRRSWRNCSTVLAPAFRVVHWLSCTSTKSST